MRLMHVWWAHSMPFESTATARRLSEASSFSDSSLECFAASRTRFHARDMSNFNIFVARWAIVIRGTFVVTLKRFDIDVIDSVRAHHCQIKYHVGMCVAATCCDMSLNSLRPSGSLAMPVATGESNNALNAIEHDTEWHETDVKQWNLCYWCCRNRCVSPSDILTCFFLMKFASQQRQQQHHQQPSTMNIQHWIWAARKMVLAWKSFLEINFSALFFPSFQIQFGLLDVPFRLIWHNGCVMRRHSPDKYNIAHL